MSLTCRGRFPPNNYGNPQLVELGGFEWILVELSGNVDFIGPFFAPIIATLFL